MQIMWIFRYQPQFIFNMDETSIVAEDKVLRVVVPRPTSATT